MGPRMAPWWTMTPTEPVDPPEPEQPEPNPDIEPDEQPAAPV